MRGRADRKCFAKPSLGASRTWPVPYCLRCCPSCRPRPCRAAPSLSHRLPPPRLFQAMTCDQRPWPLGSSSLMRAAPLRGRQLATGAAGPPALCAASAATAAPPAARCRRRKSPVNRPAFSGSHLSYYRQDCAARKTHVKNVGMQTCMCLRVVRVLVTQVVWCSREEELSGPN